MKTLHQSNPDALEELLIETGYPQEEIPFLVEGFHQGFDLQYQGPTNRQDVSKYLPLLVGSKVDLYNNLMKEVKLGWVAGPFKRPPFRNFIQSPLGLVPKSNGKLRMIFHLSYDFDGKTEKLMSRLHSEFCL